MSKLFTNELNKPITTNRGFSIKDAQRPQANKLQHLMLAILVILLCLGAARVFFQSKQTPAEVQVVAAGQDIPAGCKISFTSLHYLTIPRRYASSEMLPSYEKLVGKISSTYIKKGSPILKSELLFGSLADALSPNRRAITLRLDAESQLDNALHPGDHVDVLVTSAANMPKSNNRKYTKTLCQDLPVLLCTPREQLNSSGSRSDSNRVTLAASPSDCEKLSEAADTARIRLVLRSPAAQVESYLPGADQDDLLPGSALKKMAEEATQAVAPAQTQAFVPPPPTQGLPEPPLEDNAEAGEETKPAPLQWVVEMFSGAKKENYALPVK